MSSPESGTSSADAVAAPAPSSVWNIPNQITMVRLALAVAALACIQAEANLAATILFVVAAWTDWLDGFLARRWNQVTQLGRVLDPFVDKLVICGAFIFLAARGDQSAVQPWDGDAGDGPRDAGDGATVVHGERRQRLLGESLRQGQNGAAVGCDKRGDGRDDAGRSRAGLAALAAMVAAVRRTVCDASIRVDLFCCGLAPA